MLLLLLWSQLVTVVVVTVVNDVAALFVDHVLVRRQRKIFKSRQHFFQRLYQALLLPSSWWRRGIGVVAMAAKMIAIEVPKSSLLPQELVVAHAIRNRICHTKLSNACYSER